MTKSSFWKLINTYWKDMNNDLLLESDSKERFDFNKSLLKDVLKIHQSEKENGLENIIKDIDTKSLRGKISGCYSYKDLYFLDDNCDYYFVGDIHSDAFILEHLLDSIEFFEKVDKKLPFKVVFLGDYVDRGKNHLKTLNILLLLKKHFPENIYLLMGNHDIGKIENGEVTLYLKKVEEDMDYFYIYLNHLHQNHKDFDDELLDLYMTFMNTLNVAAFILTDKVTIKAVHGGIPRPLDDQFFYISDYGQLTDLTLDHEETRIRDCILWSDPSIQDKKTPHTGKRFKFYEDQLINYLKHMNIDLVVRGHQAIEMGHLPLFDKIHTIFSSGYVNKGDENINTDTAYDFIPPKVLHLDVKKGLPLKVLDIKLNNH
ncbi:serine/threonine protein phosphatase [Acidaminobacter sp. JC074]|uniref:metallophosphoesterase family protein n=1 Tax=Acidaminobacter sp. JC074 TaxID=2530199 RepID=UPI001F0DC12E|nr:metallophosphoesterase family protein [Acidaminobacter sp. JC074]MCH4887148.1 serine/threonine protein phosphatase [Acidaminobacter sp. JC074]